MSCSFYMFNGENVISLFLRVAGHVVKGLALSEEYFQDIALVKP